jgi:uncharacterized cysteine cluster protein YcgN (CxxCxxCC family)
MGKRASKWEDMCHRCGLCCHEKVIIGDSVIYDLDTYCEYYDPTTRQCKVYFERLEAQARCRRVNRFRAMFAPYLPESCAYVQWARSHKIRFAPKRHIRFARGELSSSSDDEYIALS